MEITYKNAEQFKGVPLTNRASGATQHIIGKAISFYGDELLLLDIGKWVTPKQLLATT